MTPAVTLDSTASMKARRASSWVFAVRKRAGLLVEATGHSVEGGRKRLNFVLASFATGTRAEKSPCLDASGGGDELADRADHAVGDLQGREDRQADDDQRAEQKRGIEPQLVDARFA